MLEPSSTGATLCSAPAMSRTTSKFGWMTTCTPRSWRDSSMVSESTRNGMSSTTTSTTECPLADQPCSLSVGRERAHLRGALRAVERQLVVRREGAVHVDVGAVDDVLGSDVSVVGMEQSVDLVMGRATGAASVLGQVGGLVDELGLVHILRRR